MVSIGELRRQQSSYFLRTMQCFRSAAVILAACYAFFFLSRLLRGDGYSGVLLDSDVQSFGGATSALGRRIVKRIDGKASGMPWKLVDWGNPLSSEEESTFTCTMTSFVSFASGETAQICVHEEDGVSDTIKKTGRLTHCNILPVIWNDSTQDKTDESLYYVEIGANIGSCVMEMLLGTKARIIAFEPHPMNLYNIKKTVSQLDKSYQDRLMLFPIGLGGESTTSKIYSATGNMGNSVIGKIIKDRPSQKFEEKNQFPVYVERLDSILNSERIKVGLMKMDAQGFECNILEGMGRELAECIDVLKFEHTLRWLSEQGCTDLLPRLSDYSFDLYRDYNGGKFGGLVNISVGLPCKFCELFAKRKSSN
ncbi:hypothetical protein ACHAXA_002010 [Cyclostephanos tholiformis]|uniref:Methyltransferase FkbM domain-containing protein n=1 Tax=Cyclostephanos tholiformis TaxID=382380 RepID=A0ABD3RZL4_9STRA